MLQYQVPLEKLTLPRTLLVMVSSMKEVCSPVVATSTLLGISAFFAFQSLRYFFRCLVIFLMEHFHLSSFPDPFYMLDCSFSRY